MERDARKVAQVTKDLVSVFDKLQKIVDELNEEGTQWTFHDVPINTANEVSEAVQEIVSLADEEWLALQSSDEPVYAAARMKYGIPRQDPANEDEGTSA